MTQFDSIWTSLTDEQVAEVEKAYAERIEALKAEGDEPEEMDAYEALSRHAEDFGDIESFDDMMDILRGKGMTYRIEHASWQDGSGWSYNEDIDNVDTALTADQLKADYEDYCENDGDEIREYDEDNNLVSSWRRMD